VMEWECVVGLRVRKEIDFFFKLGWGGGEEEK